MSSSDKYRANKEVLESVKKCVSPQHEIPSPARLAEIGEGMACIVSYNQSTGKTEFTHIPASDMKLK